MIITGKWSSFLTLFPFFKRTAIIYDEDIFSKFKKDENGNYYNERLEDGFYGSREDYEKEKNLIPIKDPYVTHFETHRSIDLKRVIKVLVQLYPELYIDDDGDFTASAQEYLDAEFDY